MATCLFRSPLAFRLQAFLETRRAAGRDDAGSQKIIRYLDHFLMSELKPGQPITREIVERWFKSMEHLSPATRINRISILRQAIPDRLGRQFVEVMRGVLLFIKRIIPALDAIGV